MDKIAQKRGLTNKIREFVSPSGLLEKADFLNPGFKDLMDNLRVTDDRVRSIVTGEQIGEAAAPEDGLPIKTVLKDAKRNLSRREYMACVGDLGIFHEKMGDIVNTMKLFDSNIESQMQRFLMEGIEDNSRERLLRLKKRMASKSVNLIKEAGLIDFLKDQYHNITRGQALAAWEKRYPKKVKELKSGIASLYAKSDKIFSLLLTELNKMASFRATRKPDDFQASLNKIISVYNQYDVEFRRIHGIIKKYLDQIVEVEEQVAESNRGNQITPPNSPPVASMEEMVAETSKIPATNKYEPVPPAPPINQYDPTGIPIEKPLTKEQIEAIRTSFNPQVSQRAQSVAPGLKPTSQGAPSTPAPNANRDAISSEENGPSTLPEGKAPVHSSFMYSLESLSGESPLIIKSYILKYAKKIAKSDPATANKLLKIANGI